MTTWQGKQVTDKMLRMIFKHIYIIGLNLPFGPLDAGDFMARGIAKKFWYECSSKS